MAEDPGLRPASVDDAAAIAEVHVRAWQAAYRDLMPADFLEGLSVAGRTLAWREGLTNGADSTLVAADPGTGRIVGFVVVGASRDDDCPGSVGELRAIYLHPDWWGKGIGSRLHEAGLATLAAGFDEATLWVLDTNQRARGFYERHGWRIDNATKQDVRGEFVLSEVRYRRRFSLRLPHRSRLSPDLPRC